MNPVVNRTLFLVVCTFLAVFSGMANAQYSITATAGANGTIAPNGVVLVDSGTTQIFSITPSSGFHVDSVIVDGAFVGTQTSFTFDSVSADHSIDVKFAIDQFTITSTAGTNGGISPSGSVIVNSGSNQSFTITPNSGYHVDSLITDGTNQGQLTSFTFTNVTANHTIRAVFAINQFTITASAGANGSISPSGSVVVNYGSSQSFTITPNTGYHVDSLIVDGANQGQLPSFTFTNDTTNHTIRAAFAINQFTITSSAGANGSISPTGSIIANFGSNQSFTITPNTGYHVDSLITDGTNQGQLTSFTFTNVTANHTIRAVFAINQFTITATAGANGSISPSGSVIVNYGSSQSFTITSNTGYHVDSLIVDGTNQGQLTSFTFTNDTTNHTIRAAFAINQFTITASAGANGSISPSGAVIANFGSNQSFTITPNTGYHVDSLITDGANQGQLTSFTFTNVTANHTIRAVFAINQFTITASAGANGSISPSGSVIVNYGSSQSFTITPNTGYHVDSLITDGANQGQLTSFTFTNVTANHTIRAVFAINQFTVTSSAGANGSISPSGAVIANFGSNQSFTITPNTGYHVDSLITDGTNQGQLTSFTFTNVTANHTIRAVFAINQFTITSSAGANGSISPSGAVIANFGSNQSFTITPNTGYHVDSLITDGSNQGQLTSFTFTNVTANHTIRAVFAINQFTITASAGTNGSISPSGSIVVNYGSNQSFTITPNTGYHVDSLIVDGANQGQLTSFTFTNDTTNHTIRAAFAINQFTITASAGANGSISPSGSVIANFGSNQSFTITPNTGYHVDSLIADGANQGQLTSFTFTNVTANHTIRAVFAINQFTITASAGTNGSISPSGAAIANYGSNQSFTITPNTGYHVDSLITDGANQGQLTSFTFTNVTANHTIRAVFAIDQFTITSSAGANGSITPSGSVVVNFGSNQSFTITPNTGYHIDSLITDGANQGQLSSFTFTNVTANHTIRAVFAINQFTITASAGANGAISPSGSVAVNYGSNQSFTITPNTGYHVDSLIVDGANQGQLTSFTFTNDTTNHTIRAAFAINQFTITASAGANGSISPSGSVIVNFSSNQSFTITPNSGYHIDSLITDGVNQGQLTSFTFTNVTSNHAIRAVFAIDQFTITASAGANGSISPSGSVIVNFGSNQSFTITPNTGYHVDSLITDGVNQGQLSSYTFTIVTANHTIRAVFAINQFTIISSAGANGSISPSGSIILSYGSNQSFTITPNTGYHVDSLITDGANQGQLTSFTFTNVTANHTIRAVFAINQFTITASAGANGSISPSGSVIVNFGSNQSFTITPNTGYHIDSLITDGVNQGQLTSFTFTNVTSNHAIRAVFAINQFTITASAGTNGSISPSGSVIANFGSDQAFTITPNSGYHVDSLITDGTNQGQLTAFTFTNVTANHTIRAVFAINQFTISATAGADGSISPSGSVNATFGSNQSFTITPNTGYHVDSLIVDGANQGQLTTFTFTNVTTNHSIRAVFAINQFTITASAGANGFISPGGSIIANFGSNQTFTITPNTGYHVDSLITDATNQGQLTSFTFTNVTTNHTIRAVFAITQFTITASAGANGSISPSGSVVLNYGSNQSFTITPNTGYHVDSLIVDGANQGQLTSFTFTNDTTNHTIRAAFAINQFTITASAGTNGSISPTGSVIVNYGSNQSFTITPNTGYHVDSLIVDGTNQGQLTAFTFTNDTTNHTIRAAFAINQFTITASAGANGSISPSGSIISNFGSNQSFTITPNTGYHVDSLIIDGANQGQLTTFTFTNVTAGHSIRAVFAINQYTITAAAGANGSISPSGAVIENFGSNQSFTITPNTGYHIDSLIVDGANQGQLASFTFTNVTTNHTITAVFAIDQFTITSTAGANGSIAPSGSVIANYGSNQTFTMTPTIGYHVDSLITDGANQGQLTTFTFTNVTANHTIRAVFAINQFTIAATAGANGTISPSGSVNAAFGGSQAFTITPNTGYHVDSLIADGANQGQLTSFTFTNITANHTIRAVFAINQFTITSSAGVNGSIAPSGSVIVNYGSSQSFTITPNTGYHVDSLIVDGANQGQLTSFTFTNDTTNHTIRATFAINQFTVTASAGANGSISPIGSIIENYGSNQSFTITPNTGYHVDSLIVDGTNQGQLATFTFTNITANHTISAVFAINQFTITSTGGANGTLSPGGSIIVNYGSGQAFTLTPGVGYHVDSLIVDGVNQGQLTSFSFTNVTANHTIRAVFAIDQFTIASTAGANGTISPSGSVIANYGSNQSFTITPDIGYHIDSLIVDGTNQGQLASFTFTNVTANHTIRAVFAIDQFTITATAGANGSISPSGSIVFSYGANQSFTIAPNTGYHIDSLIVDGSNQGQVSSFTFTNITASHTIRGVFAINQFTITSTSGVNGSISPSGSLVENYGSNQSFTITPNTGYHVDSLIVDGANQGQLTSFTFTNITASHTIRSVFAIDQFTIAASAGVNGIISPSGTIGASYGSTQVFNITPNSGYHVDTLLVDGVFVGSLTNYTFINVTSNHTISATFAINQFSITATAGQNGTISPSGSINISYGGNQTFTITPNTGYHINSLIVDGTFLGPSTSYTFTNVTGNHTISATFAIDQFVITSTAGANGTISPSGAVGVNYGSSQTFTITPGAGYHVDNLIVDGAFLGSATSYTFTNVTANHTISVTFLINQFTITATAGANGSISPSGTVNASYGGSQSFTITPGAGYHIDNLIVDGAFISPVGTYTFTNITANHTIIVTFLVNQYTITATTGPNGTISPSGAVNVNNGADQGFTITPNLGYHVDNVIVDGVFLGPITNYTFTNVTSNHSISATFLINQYTITAIAAANGNISPSGAVSVNYGANQSFSITPNTGYYISNLFVDTISVSPTNNYTFTNVSANHTISAAFALTQFTITATPGANGTMTPSGTINANYGSNQTFTFTPNLGYHVDSIIVDGVNQGTIASYTFTNVTTNHAIRSVYAINRYTITASAGPNGTISPPGIVNVTYGTSQSFTITPNTGYYISSLFVDTVSITPAGSYSFNNITGNHTITATFAINQYTITSSSGPNGSISPSGAISVNYGSSQSFALTPVTGYHVDSLIIDGVFQGAPANYTFTNIITNHSIRSVFAINQYIITASSGPNGTISPTGPVSVNFGANQSFTIVPSIGYHIDSLIVDGTNQGPLATYAFNNVTIAHTIRSVFAINKYTITATSGANGSISPSGPVSINYGASQAFTFTPVTGYHIDSVIVDGTFLGAPANYTFSNDTSDHTIRVTFTINRYTITATTDTNGIIAPSGAVIVTYGSSQRFIITANVGHHVDSVFVDGAFVDSIAAYTFTNVTAAHAINVKFAINKYTITASAGVNGTISPIGAVIVTYGSNQVFAITPNSGYRVDSLIVDGLFVGTGNTYTFNFVTVNHTITARFILNKHTLTATAGPNGTISPSGAVIVTHNANQTFTITPNIGYHIDSVLVDGVNQGPVPTYTFNIIQANHTIAAKFAINQYTIMASTGFNGSISPFGTLHVNYGGGQTYTMTPATGYRVADVIVDGASMGQVTSYTFSNVNANHTIAALFTLNVYTITATAGTNGTINPAGPINLTYGANQSFTITADNGYIVDSVLVDGTSVGVVTSYDFTNITADHTIDAFFGPIPVGAVRYRSFIYDSLHVRHATKKIPITAYWEFKIKNDLLTAITEINIQFANEVKEIVSASGLTPTGIRKDWVFAGTIAPGDTIVIKGRSTSANPQVIKKLWLGPIVGAPAYLTRFPRLQKYELPMPSIANVRDDAFARGAFVPTGGLVVGVPRPDSAKYYGWVRIQQSTDMFKSTDDPKGFHTGRPRGFDLFSDNHQFVKEQKRLPPPRQNNLLFADLMTLKFNIAVSALQITQLGFGELRYVEGGNPFDSMLVRDIATLADSMMTYDKNDPAYYKTLDSTIANINRAFSGPMDTTSWGDTLKIKGTNQLSEVMYLTKSEVPPIVIKPLAVEIPQDLPSRFDLAQNFPNPFNPTTTIEFNLSEASTVTVKIYNMVGQEVTTLVDNQLMEDGVQDVEFNANNLASGVYFYRVIAVGLSNGNAQSQHASYSTSTKKMLLLK